MIAAITYMASADRPWTLQEATLAVHGLDHCVCRRQGVGLNPNLLMKAIGETDVGFPRFGRHTFLLPMWLRFLAADGKESRVGQSPINGEPFPDMMGVVHRIVNE